MLQFPLRKTSLTEGGTDGVDQSEPWEEQGSFLGGAKVIRAALASNSSASTNPAGTLTVSDLPSCTESRTQASSPGRLPSGPPPRRPLRRC